VVGFTSLPHANDAPGLENVGSQFLSLRQVGCTRTFSRLILTEKSARFARFSRQPSARQRRWVIGPGFFSRSLDCRHSVRSCYAPQRRAVSRFRTFESRCGWGEGPDAELRPTYSISSSARTSSVGNTSSAPLGGLEIDHRFEFDRAASSGKSAGLASLRRRPTYMLVWRCVCNAGAIAHQAAGDSELS
jgi:hypothetical protein